MPEILRQQNLLDDILVQYRSSLTVDFAGYRNHCYRVLNIFIRLAALNQVTINIEQAALALAFHDIGIWSDGTVDYLPPSLHEAKCYLSEHPAWNQPQTLLMISEHHKLLPYKADVVVELFRQADLVDFSLGMVRHGVEKDYIQQLKHTFPNAGFHRRLAELGLKNWLKHPFKPAPMMKI